MLLGALYDEYLKLRARTPQTQSLWRLFAGTAGPWRLLDETDEADSDADDVPLLRDVGSGTSINKNDSPKKQSE